MILYHPKALKSCFLIYPIRNFIAASDIRYATTVPKIKTERWGKAKPLLSTYFAIFKPLAPIMTGIARKNENSAATALDVPINTAPRIVEPDLDVPGMSESI